MLKKINECLTKAEEVIGTVCIGSMFVLILIGCICRYFFNSPIKWVEEVTNLLLIWSGFLAICYATSKRSHVSIDFITNKLPEKVQCVWHAVLQLIICVTFLVLLPAGIESIKYQITTPALNLPLKLLFLIMPGSCILIMFHSIVNIVDLLGNAAGKRG